MEAGLSSDAISPFRRSTEITGDVATTGGIMERTPTCVSWLLCCADVDCVVVGVVRSDACPQSQEPGAPQTFVPSFTGPEWEGEDFEGAAGFEQQLGSRSSAAAQ